MLTLDIGYKWTISDITTNYSDKYYADQTALSEPMSRREEFQKLHGRKVFTTRYQWEENFEYKG